MILWDNSTSPIVVEAFAALACLRCGDAMQEHRREQSARSAQFSTCWGRPRRSIPAPARMHRWTGKVWPGGADQPLPQRLLAHYRQGPTHAPCTLRLGPAAQRGDADALRAHQAPPRTSSQGGEEIHDTVWNRTSVGVGYLTATAMVDPNFPKCDWVIPAGLTDPYAWQFKAVASLGDGCPTLALPYATPLSFPPG